MGITAMFWVGSGLHKQGVEGEKVRGVVGADQAGN